MRTFKIEKNIAWSKSEGNKPPIYPFSSMEIGDSFLYDEPYSRYNMSKISNAARNWATKTDEKKCRNWRFSTRKVNDNQIRIWRIQ